MKDYYKNTRECIDRYNQILEDIQNSGFEVTDEQDEFLINHCIYMAHALIKDFGTGQTSREMLEKMADIINDVIR